MGVRRKAWTKKCRSLCFSNIARITDQSKQPRCFKIHFEPNLIIILLYFPESVEAVLSFSRQSNSQQTFEQEKAPTYAARSSPLHSQNGLSINCIWLEFGMNPQGYIRRPSYRLAFKVSFDVISHCVLLTTRCPFASSHFAAPFWPSLVAAVC